MSEIENLLNQASEYAASRKRDLDVSVLKPIVELRETYEGLPADHWPAGSLKHLFTVLWPKRGTVHIPPRATLLATLDTYWRFLRGTGRLSTASASPAELKKEAKRYVRELEKASDAVLNPKPGPKPTPLDKPLVAKSAPAPAVDDAPAAQAQEVPTPEPAPVVAPEPVIAAEPDVAPVVESTPAATPAVTTTADRSDFLTACAALVEWVGEGREVTGSGVLRPAVGKQAHSELNLTEWETTWQNAMSQARRDTVTKQLGVGRSAASCFALDRLWSACTAANVIAVDGKAARAGAAAVSENHISLVSNLLQTGLAEETTTKVKHVLALAAAEPSRTINVTDAVGDQDASAAIADLTADVLDVDLWTVVEDKITVTDLGIQVLETL